MDKQKHLRHYREILKEAKKHPELDRWTEEFDIQRAKKANIKKLVEKINLKLNELLWV